jgi:hypothetical protein
VAILSDRRKPVKGGRGVSVVAASENRKIGFAAATYVAQQSCPSRCPFRGAGCYAEHGPAGFHTRRLNRAARDATAYRLAEEEARQVAGLPGLLDLRLHVVGDSRTRRGTRLLARAAARYAGRHGRSVWTYTHGWRRVPRPDWGKVSVLASCESPAAVVAAHARGYAAALVVERYERESAYPLAGADGFKLIPCPFQTRGVQCVECRLCMDADRLHGSKLVIGFAAHGRRAEAIRGHVRRLALPVV